MGTWGQEGGDSGHPVNPYEQLEEIYRSLPKVYCQGKCVQSYGPWLISGLEARRLRRRVGEIGVVNADRLCPLLNKFTGRCSVYGIRPLICRLWGVVESMRCKFGCVPDPAYLTHHQALALLRKAHDISVKMGYAESYTTSLDPFKVQLEVAGWPK